jgi:acetyltransferase-like isoleucine patch superfamily enzyme
MLHRDYFITYWKSEIDYLKRTRHDFNEESFFDIKRIDRKYDDYEWRAYFKSQVIKNYEKYIDYCFYYKHFEIDKITYNLYKYLIDKIYTRKKDLKMNAECNFKQNSIIFDGLAGYRRSYYYDYEHKRMSPLTLS